MSMLSEIHTAHQERLARMQRAAVADLGINLARKIVIPRAECPTLPQPETKPRATADTSIAYREFWGELAEQAVDTAPRRLTIERIQNAVAVYFEVSRKEI